MDFSVQKRNNTKNIDGKGGIRTHGHIESCTGLVSTGGLTDYMPQFWQVTHKQVYYIKYI